ncbi:DUF971 domain-containing protein [Nitrospina watsonii]|uniref:GBBH-like_N domain-containing protein n=1 Tax=Nitrospina watsonii TaxID=1323948 RepID=A0ABN8VWP9_9BACT|nr:DUF971 domain-containing protein [Nitrospina watsonii]CAI2718204.1 GBBH-like_N domain-containing protein [Nitrospina watsonii]
MSEEPQKKAKNEDLTPRDVKQVDESTLGITWTDGHEAIYPVKLLREKCPCAHCIDEWTGEKRIKPGQIPDTIRPIKIKAVGLYALQFDWNDGHSTGLYPYELLRNLCQCGECRSQNAA